MERQMKNTMTRQPDVDSPATSSSAQPHDRTQHPSPPARSPEDSPCKSSFSSLSSLSHGFSPERDEVQAGGPPESPPLDPLPNLSMPNHPSPSPVPVLNRYVIDEPATITGADRGAQEGFVDRSPEKGHAGRGSGTGGGRADRGVQEGFVGRPPEKGQVSGDSGAGGRRHSRLPVGGFDRKEKEAVVKKAALGFRIFELLFCMISLSVMAADKNQGWALDSFYRYKEFRYCLAVNVIGFAYALLQGSDLAYQLANGNYDNRRHHLRYYLDFAIDQVLTYLLISAGSSAATRVDDWKSNWGPDKFPAMATTSVGLAFVAFLAFAFSSVISGYLLYSSKSS